MSDSGSDSEAASGYESDKRTAEDSDWDTNDMPSAWESPPKDDDTKSQMHLEVVPTKKQQGALFDSGYQKSPSVPDESPQSLTEKPNKLSNVLSIFDNFDKINELDALRKEKKFFNFTTTLPPQEVMKKICQEIAKNPIAGPSNSRKKQLRKPQSSDSDDSAEDVKSITTCLLENSLNKIYLKEEEPAFIQELIPQPMPEPPPEPVLVVENGDLANNNRDLEGNNYPAEEAEEENPQVENDNANVNVDNNNEIVEAPPVEEIAEEVEEEAQAEVEVAWSSREALFDVNSHVDLLDDFDMDAATSDVTVEVNDPNFSEEVATTTDQCGVLPIEDSSFPNWLLQIFEDGETLPAEDLHDEPHFYCQGDGLGVHPSTVALEDEDDDDDDDDDEDDEGNESGSDSSSRSGSVDFASADNATSVQDIFATSEEPRVEENLVCVGNAILSPSTHNASVASSENDVFESAEESESNLITSSCTK